MYMCKSYTKTFAKVVQNDELLQAEKRKKIALNLRFAVGEKAVASCDGVYLQSNWILERAQSRALSKQDLI